MHLWQPSLIRNDFVALLADAIDTAAINGSGSSNQPTGILNTSGIGSVAGGTNGASPTLDHLLDLKKEIAVDNADVATCGFLTKIHSVCGVQLCWFWPWIFIKEKDTEQDLNELHC